VFLPKLSKAASGIGSFSPISPSLLNKKPEKSQQTTGLLSKGRQIVLDILLKLILYGLSLYLSILRRLLGKFIPSPIKNFLVCAGLHHIPHRF
jgi:hypothetical protein